MHLKLNIPEGRILFVSGIDTGIGKSYATGYYARLLQEQGVKVITSKPIQTGCSSRAEDLTTHDSFFISTPSIKDAEKWRNTYLFSFPASPHFSAKIEQRTINPHRIDEDTAALCEKGFDMILMEGAGGLMVPLSEDLLTIDFVAERGYPLVLVSSGRLGSINHTLLSLEAMQKRNMELWAFLFNNYPQESDLISNDTKNFLFREVHLRYPKAEWIEVPILCR